ncbi:MAG: Rieske (2Fe-2S) protein [Pseudonocardiaceae bacterium]
MPQHEQRESTPGPGRAACGNDQQERPPDRAVSRRAMVAGTGILAVTAAIAGCSSYGDRAVPPAAAPGAPPQAPSGGGLARTSDIPVGGGRVFPAEKVVVTQPAPAQFRAFSAICTHQGCTVGSVQDGTIDCPCHGSKFAVADGAVVDGPAKQPLPPREAVVDGEWVRVV